MAIFNDTKFSNLLTNTNSAIGSYNNVISPGFDNKPSGVWALESGIVEWVSSEDYSCRVRTEGGRRLYDVLCISPWFSFGTGSGIYFYPEINSRVIVGRTLGNQWFVLGFVPAFTPEDDLPYLNGKVSHLTEGDMYFCTNSGNFIQMCNTGGFIKIENTPACKIWLESTKHKIFMHSHRMYINTAAGLIRTDVDDDGHTTTTALFRMTTDNPENFVKVVIGSTGVNVGDKFKLNTDGSKTETEVIFALNICNKASITVDTEGNVVTYCKSIQNRIVEDCETLINGKFKINTKDGVDISNGGSLTLEAAKNFTLKAGEDITVSGKSNASFISGGNSTISSKGSMSITAGGSMTRASNSSISDTASAISHGAGGASPLDAPDVTIAENTVVGIVDSTISEMEMYDPTGENTVMDPTK